MHLTLIFILNSHITLLLAIFFCVMTQMNDSGGIASRMIKIGNNHIMDSGLTEWKDKVNVISTITKPNMTLLAAHSVMYMYSVF